jgi:hypothetical protein
MHGRIALLASIGALAGLGLSAADAGAVTFGADLNTATDNTYTCPAAFGANTCAIFSSAPGPAFYAPASGTVTTVRVRGGSVGGPVQVVVMRSLYQNHYGDPGHPYFACCFVEQYGPTFNVPANGVIAVPASLPMVEDATPPPNDYSTNARGDFLMLSVLDPNVTIPAKVDPNSFYSPIVPAPNPQTRPAPSTNPILVGGYSGYHVMVNADLDTSGGGGGGGGGGGIGGGGGTLRPLTIPTGGSLIGSTAAIPLTCVLTTTCNGTLKLTDQTTGLRAAKAKKINVYGSARFSIKAGKKKTVRVSLNRAGRAKLGRHSSITLTASATIGGKTYSTRVKFKHTPKKHR